MTRQQMIDSYLKNNPRDDDISNAILNCIQMEYMDYYPRRDQCKITEKGRLFVTEPMGRA